MAIDMNKPILVIIFVLIVFICLRLILSSPSDEDIIHDIIYRAKQATESQDLLKCISYVSYNYSDKDGNDRSTLFYIGKNVFGIYDNIAIAIENLKIDIINKSEAIAEVKALGQATTNRSPAQPLGLDRLEVKFRIKFRNEDGKWLITEFDFIDPSDFLRLLKSI